MLVAGDEVDEVPSAVPLTPAPIVRYDFDHVVVDVDVDEAGWLVLLDSYDDGWTATVDGESTPVRRANFAFRAIEVPAGQSTVEFTYRTPGLRQGLALTAVAMVVSIALMLLAVRRSRRSVPHG